MSTVRANSITNSAGSGAPDFPNGLTNNGVAVATTADVAAIATGPTLGTAVASTSGTAIDFTGIPSTAKRVTVLFSGVSVSTGYDYLIQIGSGSFLTSGYSSVSGSGYTNSSGFIIAGSPAAANTISGSVTLSLVASNSWVSSGAIGVLNGTTQLAEASGGRATLSGALDRVRITTDAGIDTFDAGTINISWE